MDENLVSATIGRDRFEELLERIDMPHYDDKHFDDLCKEALIADLLALFHDCLDLLPDVLRSAWTSRILLARQFNLAEKGLNKLANELWLE